MRLALAASSYLPRIGGVEEHVHHLARELTARGHDVEVWVVDQGDRMTSPDGFTVRALPCPLPSRSVRGIAGFMARWPAAAKRWRRAVTRFRPDVIDIQCFGPNGPYAAAMARRCGVPLVYSNHGETFMDATDVFAQSALLRERLGLALRSARVVTSCSAYAADDLTRFGPHPDAVVVGNGVDLGLTGTPVRPGLPPRFIAAVGRVVENKGFAVLIRAFARLREVELGLVIAGDGPYLPQLRGLADSLGVSDRVRFTGSLTRRQVASVLDDALVHVVPSRVEAFGIVILEGWRSHTPVLSTNRGGPAEFVTDGVDGVLFDPDDVDALADALRNVVSDEALRTRLVAAGAARVRAFTWDRVADRYEAAFSTAVRPAAEKTDGGERP